MSNKKLTILAIVAVVMVILAVVQSYIATGPAEPETPGYLIPGLNTARIGSIVLGKGDNIVTLNRTAGRFVVANKDNYPAKVSEINNLLSKCQEIRWSQFITDNPENHEDLGVTEEKATNVVKFLTPEPNSTILAGVIVGGKRETGSGTYVRLLSSDKQLSNKVYIADSIPWLGNQVINYIEQNITSFKREEIESVTVVFPNGEYTLKAKEDSKDLLLENIPQGKKLKTSDSQDVFTALTNLRFDDVTNKSSGLLFDRKYVCRLKTSAVYTIDIAQKNDKTYITCQASFKDTIERPKQDESEEQLKEKEAKLLDWEKTKVFSERHQGWIYEIPNYKAKNLTKELSDLLEDAPQPQEPNEINAEESNAVNAKP
jgi:hypothetical protein